MKYMKNNYDRVELKLPKGEKVIYQEHAESMGESLNSFTNRAMKETLDRDTKKADS